MKDQTPEVVTGPALLVRFPWLKYPEIDVSQSENKISSTSKHRLKSRLKPKKTMAFNSDCFEKQYKELCNLKNKRRIAIELCSLEQFRVMSDREKQGYLASRCVHKLTRMDEGEANVHQLGWQGFLQGNLRNNRTSHPCSAPRKRWYQLNL
ncbi:hypothetical protein [Methylomonas sp. 11b]|uniref:hypothetical protein n=1 Tax=Methylomonas sp. 11b TaxID=1168169 RepID=UPI00047D7776|nr:hypothetical protein [Methylomonas sp. 11b]